MKAEEFEQISKQLKDKYELDKRQLGIRYADANNQYKVGDIIEDHYHIIKVERISYDYIFNSNGKMECKFIGVQLKRDLTPTKRQDETVMYQNCIIRKLN